MRQILENKSFYHYFQPIYDINNWNIYGYEALLRSDYYSDPDTMFQIAKECGILYELDTLSFHCALNKIKHFQHRLFINVFPSTLIDTSFRNFVQKLDGFFYSNNQIIFEIVEGKEIENLKEFFRNIQYLKEKGFQVALDDFGKEEISLQALVDLNPHYLKVDRSIAYNIHKSNEKKDIVKKLLYLCERTNIKLILEGIEKQEDLAMAKILGVQYAQGFLLGKPLP
jgi:EAL domain-containing protein (putative c-di-GMP-specific phosphodiesterase class I)